MAKLIEIPDEFTFNIPTSTAIYATVLIAGIGFVLGIGVVMALKVFSK